MKITKDNEHPPVDKKIMERFWKLTAFFCRLLSHAFTILGSKRDPLEFYKINYYKKKKDR